MSTGSPQVILIRCSYLSYHVSITLAEYDQQKRAVHLYNKFIEFGLFFVCFLGVIRCSMNIIDQILIIIQIIPVGLLQKKSQKLNRNRKNFSQKEGPTSKEFSENNCFRIISWGYLLKYNFHDLKKIFDFSQ